MSLLSIANAVADETKGPRPETIATNTDPAAQNILRLVNKVGNRLQKAYAWNILTREATLTASGSETLIAASALPGDFDRIIPETMWDRGTNNLISGPVSAVEWQGLKVQSYASQNKKWRYRYGDILTSPAVDAGNTVAYEYVSSKWAKNSGGVVQTSMTADTDTAVISEELIIYGTIWEWLDSEGQPSASAFQQFKSEFDSLVDADEASADILTTGDIFAQNSRHFTGEPKASRASYGGDF